MRCAANNPNISSALADTGESSFRMTNCSEMCDRYVLLPVAGNRNNSNGSLNNVGSNGNYWSATVDGTNARNLNFNSSNANMNSNNRANGNSVRCLKDYNLQNSATSFGSITTISHSILESYQKSKITNLKSQITNHKSQTINHKSEITNHKSQI